MGETKARRLRLLPISERSILDVMNYHRFPGRLTVPALGQLPEDAVVERVTFDAMRNCFLVCVWSSEFEIVPENQIIPVFDPFLMESVEVNLQPN